MSRLKRRLHRILAAPARLDDIERRLGALESERALEAGRPREALEQKIRELEAELARYKTWAPPGHYLSPIPALDEVRAEEARIFAKGERALGGIDLNEAEQMQQLERIAAFYGEMPWSEEPTEGLRYYLRNDYFVYSDAICLYGLIRDKKPGRIIEIGTGFSSAAILDTNELFFENSIPCSFFEPYPDRFYSTLKPGDVDRIEVVEQKLQDVPLERFAALEAGDLLCVDSTHVSKIDSDVNHMIFRILPSLASGVYVHFHDIFFPFEYPPHWVYEGRAWNELYVMRAFLEYNTAFRIVYFNSFLEQFHEDFFAEKMPLTQKCPGCAICLQKL